MTTARRAAAGTFGRGYGFRRLRLPVGELVMGAALMVAAWYAHAFGSVEPDAHLWGIVDPVRFFISLGHPVGSILLVWGLFRMGRVMAAPREMAFDAAALPIATGLWMALQPMVVLWLPPGVVGPPTDLLFAMFCIAVGFTVAGMINAVRCGAVDESGGALELGVVFSLLHVPVYALAVRGWFLYSGWEMMQ